MDLDGVRHIYALPPLTQAVVTALNVDVAMKDLAEELAAARYPSRLEWDPAPVQQLGTATSPYAITLLQPAPAA